VSVFVFRRGEENFYDKIYVGSVHIGERKSSDDALAQLVVVLRLRLEKLNKALLAEIADLDDGFGNSLAVDVALSEEACEDGECLLSNCGAYLSNCSASSRADLPIGVL